MINHSIRHPFIPWNPHLHQGEDTSCPICLDPLPERPETAAQIPLKHEGVDGEKHPSAHLGCLRSWLEQSDLCMLCNHPLEEDQLTLFLDAVESFDLASLDFKQLKELSKQATDLLDTPEGNLKIEQFDLKRAIKNLEAIFIDFSNSSEEYTNLLETLVSNLKKQLETSEPEEYLMAAKSIETANASGRSRLEKTYAHLTSEFQKLNRTYQKESHLYLLNKKLANTPKDEPFYFFTANNALMESSEPFLAEKAREIEHIQEVFCEIDLKIQSLKMRHKHLVYFQHIEKSLNRSLLIWIPIYFLLIQINHRVEIARGNRDPSTVPGKNEQVIASVTSLGLALFLTFVSLYITKNSRTEKDLLQNLDDLLVLGIRLPAKKIYHEVSALF